jgi:hypothetical protein
MDILVLQCVSIDQYDGWACVSLEYFSLDPTIYAGGNVSFTITDASGFEIGKRYGLNLEEIPL